MPPKSPSPCARARGPVISPVKLKFFSNSFCGKISARSPQRRQNVPRVSIVSTAQPYRSVPPFAKKAKVGPSLAVRKSPQPQARAPIASPPPWIARWVVCVQWGVLSRLPVANGLFVSPALALPLAGRPSAGPRPVAIAPGRGSPPFCCRDVFTAREGGGLRGSWIESFSLSLLSRGETPRTPEKEPAELNKRYKGETPLKSPIRRKRRKSPGKRFKP